MLPWNVTLCFVVFGATVHSGPGPPHSRIFNITHKDASQSVGLLWSRDQPVAETCTWQHATLTTDRHLKLRWDSNPQSQQASVRRPTHETARPLGSAVALYNLWYWKSFSYSHRNNLQYVWLGTCYFCSIFVFFTDEIRNTKLPHHRAWTGPEGSRILKLLDFLDNQHMKVARLSVLHPDRLSSTPPPRSIPSPHLC